jgi:hypothetical protein
MLKAHDQVVGISHYDHVARGLAPSPAFHLCAADSDNERIQRIMRAAPWPKPIRETEEIFLVDRVQHCKRCSLDDFVL